MMSSLRPSLALRRRSFSSFFLMRRARFSSGVSRIFMASFSARRRSFSARRSSLSGLCWPRLRRRCGDRDRDRDREGDRDGDCDGERDRLSRQRGGGELRTG